MKTQLVLLIFVVSLFGCVPSTDIPTRLPSPAIESAIPTSRAIVITPTVSQPIAIPTLAQGVPPIVAPLPAYAYSTNVQAQCVEVSQKLQTGNLGTGVVILENRVNGLNGRHQPGLYFFNMDTGLLNSPLGRDRYARGSVSPDGNLLVAWAEDLGDIIMTADGKVLSKLPTQSYGGSEWLNSQQIISIKYEIKINPNEVKAFEADPRLVTNPLTGEQRLLQPDFPDIYDNCCHQPSWGGIVYNPLLNRAVYLAMPGTIFVLWDLQEKKPLLSWTQFFHTEQNVPRWSPDGSKFIFYGIMGKLASMPEGPTLPYKLYLADNDGSYSELVSDSANLPISDYFWSPSGRYLAFTWQGVSLGSDGYNNARLVVLDTWTKGITDYCVEYTPSRIYGELPLIWSHNETQIILNDHYSDDHMRVILVNLANGTAFPIVEDMLATGWMKAPE